MQGRGVCRQSICYYVAAIVVSFNLIIQQDHFSERFNSDFLTPPPGFGRGRFGSVCKMFATMLLHIRFPLI